MKSGAFRQVSAGTPGAEWEEGAGWIVYDQQAARETKRAAAAIALDYWKRVYRKSLDAAGEALSKIDKFTRETKPNAE